MITRSQALVLGFFVMVVGSLVVIRAAAPDVYEQALSFPPSWPRWANAVFPITLAAFLTLVSIGQ